MTVALLTIEDGRTGYHEKSWASLREQLPDVDHIVSVDDSDHKLGFAGAVATGWAMALETDAEYIAHCELDFIYLRPVPLDSITAVLKAHPYLVQMALLRGPVNEQERAAGGVIEQHPESYTTVRWNGCAWREHRRHVTTNPCVWPRWVVERGWPLIDQSEGHFGIQLFNEDPTRRAAYWGTSVDIEHIGDVRAGHSY